MNNRALCLFSGGLDSILSLKLLEKQKIDCVTINFTTPFFRVKNSKEIYQKYNIDLIDIDITDDFIEMLQKPKHGYGSAFNPCIDCKILMMKKAKQLLKNFNASFIVTGEVMGQRPMSQQKRTMEIIEREAGVRDLLLRPLSAKLLPETEIEKKHIVEREQLLDISGRSRKKQLELAKEFNITDFVQPAGGCILTEKEFEIKIRDFFKYNKNYRIEDIELLKYGRHFRIENNKIVVGRNEFDNNQILKYKNENDITLFAKDFVGPTTIIEQKASDFVLEIASLLTLSYSDCDKDKGTIVLSNKKELTVDYIDKKEFNKYRLKI